MPRVALTLLGGFAVRLAGDVPVRFPRRKAVALLAYLACGGAHPHPRDKLGALLWPEVAAAHARHSLRQTLASLRQGLPPEAIRVDDAALALDFDAIDVDVVAFRRLVDEGTPAAHAQAAALYAGDLLAGIDVGEAGPFEEWLQSEREALHELALSSLARLLASQRDTGDTAGALHTALRLLALDPLQEVVHRTVMRLQAAQGRRDAALRQYQACVALLQRELAVEPEAETKELYAEILRQRERPAPPPERARDAGRADVAAAAGPDIDAADGPAAIVGRDAELAALERALAGPVPGRQRLVMVLGEAGIGKSRLLAEFRARALGRGARVLLGRSYESAQVVPFAPWVDALRRAGAAGHAVARDLDPVWRRELTRLLPELGEPGQDVAEATNDPGRVFEAVARLLEALAAQQPVVVMLEDVHWADDMSVRLLAALARRPRRAPLALAASARDDELGDAAVLRAVLGEVAREQRLDRLALAPLSLPETAELTQRLARAGSDGATVASLAERLWEASRGLPFMIVEAMAAIDQGAGVSREGGERMPERVRDVIAGRLARLSDRARALVGVAAVIGREFDFSLLRAAAGLDENDAATAVEELVRRRILRLSDERFDFTHDRIREVALAEILPPRRRILHRQVADALQPLAAEAPEHDWAALGEHCREAGLWERAAHAFLEAGRTASRRSAERDAAASFEAALAALARAPRSAAVLAQTIDVNLELRNSRLVIAELRLLPPCLAAAGEAARELGDARRQAWVSLYAGQLRWWGGEAPDPRAFAELAEGIVAASDDRSLQATGSLYAGFAWYNAGDYRRAHRSLTRTLDLLRDEPVHRRHGHQSLPIPFALAHRARAHSRLGNIAEGLRDGEEAFRLAEDVGHDYAAMNALSSLSRLRITKGDLDEAIQLQRRAEEIARGQRIGAEAAASYGYALALGGRVAEGVARLEAQRAAMDQVGWNVLRAAFIQTLAHAYAIAGRLEEAEACGRESLTLARERGERGAEGWALWVLGETAWRQEAGSVARGRFEEALGIAAELGMRPLEAYCELGLGRLLAREGEAKGKELLSRAAALAREMDMRFWPA